MNKLNKLINKPQFNKRSKRWEIRYSEGNDPVTGKRQRTVLSDKTKAGVRAKALAYLKERLEGGPVTSDTITSVYLRQWHRDRKSTWEYRTAEVYEYQIEQHIIPEIGDLLISEVRAHHVQKMVGAIAEAGLAPTANKCRRLLLTAFEDAVDSDLISKNPVKTVKQVKEQPREIKRPEPSEIRKLLDSSQSHRLFAAFYMLIATGLRRGELLGLKWEDLDESGIRIQRALKLKKNTPILGTLKTNSSRRFVALPKDVLTVLEEHRARQQREKADCHGSWTDTGLIFTTAVGTWIHPRNFRHILNAQQKKAGVTQTSIHAFRHSHASLLIGNDLDIRSISARLGHSSTSFTMDRYGHELQVHRHKAALPVAQLLGEATLTEASDSSKESAK